MWGSQKGGRTYPGNVEQVMYMPRSTDTAESSGTGCGGTPTTLHPAHWGRRTCLDMHL